MHLTLKHASSSEDWGRTPVLAKLAIKENIGVRIGDFEYVSESGCYFRTFGDDKTIWPSLRLPRELDRTFGETQRAKVTVWGKDGTPAHVVERYIAQLLKGLVPARRISIVTDDIRRAQRGKIAEERSVSRLFRTFGLAERRPALAHGSKSEHGCKDIILRPFSR